MRMFKERKKGWWILKIAMILSIVALTAVAVMLLWNWLMPEITGAKSISYLQALGLLFLSKLLFSGFSSHHRHPKYSHVKGAHGYRSASCADENETAAAEK